MLHPKNLEAAILPDWNESLGSKDTACSPSQIYRQSTGASHMLSLAYKWLRPTRSKMYSWNRLHQEAKQGILQSFQNTFHTP